MALTPNVVTYTLSCKGQQDVNVYEDSSAKNSKDVLILLHGSGGSVANNFPTLFPMLAAQHHVIAFDFNDGEAEVPILEDYLDQVDAVVKSVPENSRIHLIGYSFGAVIGLAYAAKNTKLLTSLTVVAGWAKTDAYQKMRNRIWVDLCETNSSSIGEFTVFLAFSHEFFLTKSDEELGALAKAVGDGKNRLKKMRFNRNVDISASLPDVTVPSLVIGCVHDLMVPISHSKSLFQALPDARYVEIESGHGVVHECTSELFTTIDNFIRELQ